MSEKPSRWNNPEFLTSLMMCFYGQLKGDGLSKEAKDAIEARLQNEGYPDVTWNGIRYVCIFLCFCRSFHRNLAVYVRLQPV